MSKVIIFGVGQIAEIARVYLEFGGEHQVVGYCADRERLDISEKDSLPTVAWEDLEERFPADQYSLFVPIGYSKVNLARKERYLQTLARGYDMISFIHPGAYYYDTPVGKNCFIQEANVIQPYSTIGDNVILWSGNHIGHHTTIGDHCFIASHVVISGGVTIGERCFFGVNATVRDGVRIGDGCVIGAGAIVMGDLPDESVVLPAQSSISNRPSSRLRKI